jgi:SAM-dependent methyltransferase
MRLAEIADKLNREGIFTGGPPHLFEAAGRMQLATLLREGLQPSSRVLDIGCGCLRAGYWLVRLLDLGCYFGIEPNAQMLDAGIQYVLDGATRAKKPRFDNNDQFDFSVFGVKFDVFLARSIWTHASKDQIQVMLDGFVQHSTPEAFFLSSYLPPAGTRGKTPTTKGTTGLEEVTPPPSPVWSRIAADGLKKNANREAWSAHSLMKLRLTRSTG